LGLGSSAFAKLNGLDRKHGWRMCSLASPISKGTVICCLGNGRRRALPDPTAKIAVLTERLAKERDSAHQSGPLVALFGRALPR
jgi:hypothetical protein